MKNYTHILNEGFDSYFKKLNEASSFDYGDSPYIIVDNIEWDTEGEYVDNLPDKLYVPYDELLYREESLSDVDVEELKDRIADYLSNEYGYLVFGFDTPANDTVNLDESKLNETSTALPDKEKRQPNRDYLINTLMWGDIKGAILNGNYEQAAELLRNFADVLEQLAVDPYKQFNVEITLKSKLDGKSIFKSPKEKIKWLEDVLGDDASVSKVGPNTFNVMVVVDKYDDEAEDRISKTMEDYSSIISQYKISELETL